MSSERFEFALNSGLILPETGRILLIAPKPDMRIDALAREGIEIFSRFAPDHHLWSQRGVAVKTTPDAPYAATVVFLPRSKDLARAYLWQAAEVTPGGLLVVDGQKTDGIGPMAKALGVNNAIAGQISKAHGKLLWITDLVGVPADWQAKAAQIDGGFQTWPGVFSADGADPASVALLTALPSHLGRAVADFGAGWGFLSRALVEKQPERVHLVEADLNALDCARQNIPNERALFHWADATDWQSPELLDSIIMNPPFHAGRKAEPTLGQTFIANAARNLKPTGQLWMVANRHLPYEDTLAQYFRQFDEIGGDNRFKIFQASRPTRNRR